MSNKPKNITLNCPIPKMDFDKITLAHGSGGLLTNKLLDSGVFSLLENDMLQKRHDGATFDFKGKVAFSTDSFVVSPIFFPGGNIGELAVNGTVNDLAMCGATPKYLSLGLILEEGLGMNEFWDILVSIKAACQKAGVEIITGDTKVVERGKGDKVFINTTGIGEVHPKASIDLSRVKKGDKIIISGKLAAHGMAIMSVREGLEFETDILSDTQNLNHLILSLLEDFGQDVHLLRDPTRGGVATVLNEIAEQSSLGIVLEQNDLPIDPQVNGACELLGLDPLYVANEGIFLSFIEAGIVDEYLEKARTLPEGQSATCIGEVVDDHPGKVIMKSAVGGKRVVNMLAGEQLPRIC